MINTFMYSVLPKKNQETGVKEIRISLVTFGLQSSLSTMINKITFLFILCSTFLSNQDFTLDFYFQTAI